jgi:beta-aspartyl-peptidase (threonine type)
MKTIALAPLLLFVASAQPASNIVLVAHSGAGDYNKMTPPVVEARRDGMLKTIRDGYAILCRGGTGLDAVEATIRAIEDSGLYDSGRGAYYTKDGVVALDQAGNLAAGTSTGARC